MKKNLHIFIWLVVLPFLAALLYNWRFQMAGNWFEDHLNTVLFWLFFIPIISSVWIFIRSLRLPQSFARVIWLILSFLLSISLIIFTYLVFAFSNIQIG